MALAIEALAERFQHGIRAAQARGGGLTATTAPSLTSLAASSAVFTFFMAESSDLHCIK
jgi:hypothetical protein